MTYLQKVFPVLAAVLCIYASCKKGTASGGGTIEPPPAASIGKVEAWVTTGDRTSLLQKQTDLSFTATPNAFSSISVDSASSFQTVDGFGYTLTGGSAYVINKMGAAEKATLLRQLFSDDAGSIKITWLRISIGASDLNASVFSYNDLPAGETDIPLDKFSLNPDRADLIPLLKEIVAIRPSIKILATPWSAPVWMKTNASSIGGRLKTEYYDVYARYFVKFIQQMKAEGITIHAVTPQNEPLNPYNNPSMEMSAGEQTSFIKNNLGPAFQSAGVSTKIIVYDHNLDRTDYPLAILGDAAAKAFVDGSAFHLYAGDIAAMSAVHDQHPDKNVYFTEQYTASTGNFGGDLKWHLKNVLIGSQRNYSRVTMEWNLANDAAFGPYTPGGCNTCLGALTINGNSVTRNVAYYIIAHASSFLPPGSVRIASTVPGVLNNVAFVTPSGKKVLIVENDGSSVATFNIKYKNQVATTTLGAGSVATYTW